MIDSKNIKEYINFLHMKKYSAPASEELKSRWSVLHDHEIASQLQGLYLHWGIDGRTAAEYEDTFLRFQQSTTAVPLGYTTTSPSSAAPQAPAKGNNKTVVYISLIIALLGLCGFMFYKMSQQISPQQPLTDTGSVAPVSDHSETEVSQNARSPVNNTVIDSTKKVESDPVKVKVIEGLLKAEENRDMSGILNCFSPNLQQYWDVKNPAQSDLVSRYNNTWTKTSDNANHDVRIERISDNVYDMYSVYEYYSNKDGQAKSVNTHVRYIFDDNNKIVKTFGVK